MARKTPQETLETLTQKKAQLEARISTTKAKVRSQERKRDTRRKIIAGALALEHAAHDAEFGATLKRLLQEHVTRDTDRTLFDL